MITKSVRYLNKCIAPAGIRLSRLTEHNSWVPPVEATEFDKETIKLVSQFTMTSPARVWALISAVKYIIQNQIPGDFCECGVWRGGSVLAITRTLQSLGIEDRKIYLYDTFEGMSKPDSKDIESFSGVTAKDLLEATPIADGNNVWAYADLEDVKNTLKYTNYPHQNYVFVEGDVIKTLTEVLPEELALLRLDTDWYESTKIELEKLYPVLVEGGVILIDDYGHWEGARTATDDFFTKQDKRPLLMFADYTGRIGIKI